MPQTPPEKTPPGETPEEPSGELVVVARFREAPEANKALALLQGKGLKAFLADENTVTVNFLYSGTVGGIRLMVHASQAGRAVDLLERSKSR